MKRSNRLVIFVGVLLAILAFVGIVIVLNGQTTGAQQRGADDGHGAGGQGRHRHRHGGHA